MIDIVVDASVALAWCFPDEANQYADSVLLALEGKRVLVPAIWSFEITNAMAVAERRKRLSASDVSRFIELLEGLTIHEEAMPAMKCINSLLPLTRSYNLSAYDAAYLATAIQRNAPLATADAALKKAARKAGAEVF